MSGCAPRPEWMVVNGDCLDVLRSMPDASIDAVVTDPPYGLSDCSPAKVAECVAAWARGERYEPRGGGFMGRSWDAWVPGPEVWREVLRVLRPGGHALVFAGARTLDLMGLALRLAGFEVRDCLQWLYGSGFPKSHDVSKAIDREAGAEREAVGVNPSSRPASKRRNAGGFDGHKGLDESAGVQFITAPATPEAARWDGWGTALKPANEPILLARKPLDGTVAGNVLAHGVGGLNVGGCRVETSDSLNGRAYASATPTDCTTAMNPGLWNSCGREYAQPAGRWPPNVLLTHAPGCPGDRNGRGCVPGCVVGEMGAQSGELSSGRLLPSHDAKPSTGWSDGSREGRVKRAHGGDTGTAARFFPSFRYSAKASKAEREAGVPVPEGERRGNRHPTVKPVDLMRWLVRLITPPGATVLDPFTGSGTTGIAATLEGARFIGVERDGAHAALARTRIAWWGEHGEGAVKAWKRAPDEARRGDAPEPVEAGAPQLRLFAGAFR